MSINTLHKGDDDDDNDDDNNNKNNIRNTNDKRTVKMTDGVVQHFLYLRACQPEIKLKL